MTRETRLEDAARTFESISATIQILAALYFGVLVTLLLYSKVDPAFHEWKTRYFGELPHRWGNKWLVKVIIPRIIYVALFSVVYHYLTESIQL